MQDNIKPNSAEKIFLNLAYARFYDLYAEIMMDTFFHNEDKYRFTRIKEIFLVYSELLNYEPIKYMIELIKTNRPPMEAEISKDLLKFIRNIIIHFPFFETWDEVWLQKEITNWNGEGKSIDLFLKKYSGKEQVKYRMWLPDKKEMLYVDITFPMSYSDEKLYLKDILQEDKGILFAINLMKNILDTQLIKD